MLFFLAIFNNAQQPSNADAEDSWTAPWHVSETIQPTQLQYPDHSAS